MKPLEPQHSHEHPSPGIVAWNPNGYLEGGAADLWIVEIENLSLGGWEVGRPWVYLNPTTILLFCSAQESWTENRNFLYGFVCFFSLMWTFENPIKPLLLVQEEASRFELLQLCSIALLSPGFLESFSLGVFYCFPSFHKRYRQRHPRHAEFIFMQNES